MDRLEKTIQILTDDFSFDENGIMKITREAVNAIVELLKEKQPKKVKDFQYLADLFVGKCPSCGEELNNEVYPAFCGFCGQRISWKGGEQE